MGRSAAPTFSPHKRELIDYFAHASVVQPDRVEFFPASQAEAFYFAVAKARVRCELRRGTARESYGIGATRQTTSTRATTRTARRPRTREHRPAGQRRTAASSSTSSSDPGESEPPELGLWRHPKYGRVNRLMAAFLEAEEPVE